MKLAAAILGLAPAVQPACWAYPDLRASRGSLLGFDHYLLIRDVRPAVPVGALPVAQEP